MKTMKMLVSVMIAVLFSFQLTAQDSKLKKETLNVSGNCDMCKSRIEAAAKSGGAVNAAWDARTQILAVTFDGAKTNPDNIAKKVAAAGHDAGKFKSEDKVYNALPGCCKYDRNGSHGTDNSGNAPHSMHSHH